MPSSWSPSLRFELQFTGENINLWGDKLNAVLGHADYAVAGCFGTMVLFAGVGFLSLKSDHPNLAPQRGGQWLMR